LGDESFAGLATQVLNYKVDDLAADKHSRDGGTETAG